MRVFKLMPNSFVIGILFNSFMVAGDYSRCPDVLKLKNDVY